MGWAIEKSTNVDTAWETPGRVPDEGEWNSRPTGNLAPDTSAVSKAAPTLARYDVCRNCKQEGHFTRDCKEEHLRRDHNDDAQDADRERPDVNTMTCYNCNGIGHGSRSCTEPKRARSVAPLIDWSHRPEMDSELAWEKLKLADKSRDLDDVKEAFEVYAKNTPEATLQTIEKRFRKEDCNTRLIAFKKDIPPNKTNVDLQLQGDKTYALGFQLSKKSRRSKMNEDMLAETYEENFERLADCGFTVMSPVPVCFVCEQKGHLGRDCPDKLEEGEKDLSYVVKIVCSNCEQEGHRLRNCPEPRKVRTRGCRNCGNEGHMVVDCDQPRRPREGESCHNCGSEEHYGKDCPDPRADTRTCHNCSEAGHVSRDCPNPRVDTRTCHNCSEAGHIGRDCPKPRSNCAARGTSNTVEAEDSPADQVSGMSLQDSAVPMWGSGVEVPWETTPASRPSDAGWQV